ncbi:hypothetical protein, partial [Mycobacterium avium]|uniref:hypothetical protein n=1 Tax=Mycobacterium avium TaxID=1764 RepID=UPI003F67E5B5
MTRVSFGQREPDGAGFCPPGVRFSSTIRLSGSWLKCPRKSPRSQRTPDGSGGGLVEAEYLVEVLDQQLVEQMLRHYRTLLDSLLSGRDARLSACALMSGAD